jgi:hypothetical protein
MPKRPRRKTRRKPRKLRNQGSPSPPPLLLTETSYASPSQNPLKRDAFTAQLALSRLHQITSPALMDSIRGALHVQEFFFSRSLLSIDAYYMQEKAFPKEWVDMKAFFEKVFPFSC